MNITTVDIDLAKDNTVYTQDNDQYCILTRDLRISFDLQTTLQQMARIFQQKNYNSQTVQPVLLHPGIIHLNKRRITGHLLQASNVCLPIMRTWRNPLADYLAAIVHFRPVLGCCVITIHNFCLQFSDTRIAATQQGHYGSSF